MLLLAFAALCVAQLQHDGEFIAANGVGFGQGQSNGHGEVLLPEFEHEESLEEEEHVEEHDEEHDEEENEMEEEHSIFSPLEPLSVSAVAFWTLGILTVTVAIEKLYHYLRHHLNPIEIEIARAQIQELQILGTLSWITVIAVQSKGLPLPEDDEELLLAWEFAHFVAFTAGVFRVIVAWYTLGFIRFSLNMRRQGVSHSHSIVHHSHASHDADPEDLEDAENDPHVALKNNLRGKEGVEIDRRWIKFCCPSPSLSNTLPSNHGLQGLYGEALDAALALIGIWGKEWPREKYESGAWKTIRLWGHAVISDFVVCNSFAYLVAIVIAATIGTIWELGGDFGDNGAQAVFAAFGGVLFVFAVWVHERSRLKLKELIAVIRSTVDQCRGADEKIILECRERFDQSVKELIVNNVTRLRDNASLVNAGLGLWEQKLIEYQIRLVAGEIERKHNARKTFMQTWHNEILEAVQLVTGYHFTLFMIHWGPRFAQNGEWAWFILVPIPDLLILFFIVPRILCNYGLLLGLGFAVLGAEELRLSTHVDNQPPNWLNNFMKTPDLSRSHEPPPPRRHVPGGGSLL